MSLKTLKRRGFYASRDGTSDCFIRVRVETFGGGPFSVIGIDVVNVFVLHIETFL